MTEKWLKLEKAWLINEWKRKICDVRMNEWSRKTWWQRMSEAGKHGDREWNKLKHRLTSAMTTSASPFMAEKNEHWYFLRCMLSTSVRYQVPGNRADTGPTGLYGARGQQTKTRLTGGMLYKIQYSLTTGLKHMQWENQGVCLAQTQDKLIVTAVVWCLLVISDNLTSLSLYQTTRSLSLSVVYRRYWIHQTTALSSSVDWYLVDSSISWWGPH